MRNYTSFESLDEYYRYMAYHCRKATELSLPDSLIDWHAVGYGYRSHIMRPL